MGCATGLGPACWNLADREAYISWTDQQRAERLGLIVQNRRFLVLGNALRILTAMDVPKGEQSVALELYAKINLEGATITGECA